MLRTKKIPSKPRFDYARDRAYKLLVRLGVTQFPVDPFWVEDYFPDIHILKYTELQTIGCPDPFDFDKKNAKIDIINETIADPKKKLHHVDGLTVVQRETKDYLVVYDDRIGNEQRIRWTVAHELAHIFCRHLVDFEETALERGGLTKEQYGVLEVEANWFVSEFLAPRAVLRVFNFEKPNEISLLCDISKTASEKRFSQLKKFSYASEDSNHILRNFYAHLASGEYLKVIFHKLCEFTYAPFYGELADACRVCRDCGAVIAANEDKFCRYCGKESVIDAKLYDTILLFGNATFEDAVSLNKLAELAKTNVPRSFDGKENRLLFCPVCKNSEISEGSGYCRICGSPLVNFCTDCFKELESDCRYCPECGAEANIKSLYDREQATIVFPDEYDDYLEYEYWDFIKVAIGYWDGGDISLYASLSDAVMYCDDTDFVLATPYPQLLAHISDNLSEIKSKIAKYGKTNIENLTCIAP